jgi:integrase
MLQNGDDYKTLQDALGHHSAGFTLDTYGHVTDKMRKDSADRMEAYIQSLPKSV